MIYQVDRIKEDVRACMDQDQTSVPLVSEGDMDVLMLDQVIESKILEAVERVECAAPYHLLEQGHNFDGASDAVYWGDLESGWVLLPEDFMRLVVFKMSDWERPVYTTISPDDPMYARQGSRVKALRGTAQRPVCAIGVRPEGKVLEFWSCKDTTATVARAVYVPQPAVDADGYVDISERCYTAVVYTCAALTLTACGEVDKAKNMFEMAKTYLTK